MPIFVTVKFCGSEVGSRIGPLAFGIKKMSFSASHPGRHRPHHVVQIENVDVVVDDDDVFGIEFGAEVSP